ncbi:hypothetical protein BO70DRAFT_360423 [Aspergillus heteromorphus CBS 117.55]|uniref:Uncharacterized protein n=1 Tax=Aspergillus heteromorphus CBS 117.55 TaxID=1448321 RepID=A0A317WN11_9EURO|nr:uncharacterized protein BO70DRAFT_360423 [Aspergillus heteromorphus CBS 117.55]PWY87789.1 hypothetical protein BO70DRAFT_360423 [Aspergillus heteromorphus CBS 117.55]
MTSPLSPTTGHPLIQKEKPPGPGPGPGQLSTVPETTSTLSSPEVPSEEFNPCTGAKPSSPFYRHATPSLTIERLTKGVKATATAKYRPIDLENPPMSNRHAAVSATHHRESKLWVQEKRHCGWMKRLGKKQRLAVKVGIAILTLGTMIAIALGITVAVGGAVWRSDTRQEVIGR